MQTRSLFLTDHQEPRVGGSFIYGQTILDMGATQEERDAFVALNGTPVIEVDAAFDVSSVIHLRAEFSSTNHSGGIIGGALVGTLQNVPGRLLVEGYRFNTGVNILEGITTRYLTVKFKITSGQEFTQGQVSAFFLTGHKDMKSKLTFDVNGPEDEGKLEYLLDNDVYDTWVYNQGRVIAEARPSNVHVHYPQAVIGFGDRDKWMEFIRVNYAPVVWPRGEYNVEFEKNADNVTLMVKLNGVIIETDVWDAVTNYITYGTRPEIDWSWADFFMYSKYLKDFMNAIATFNKQS